MNAYQNFWNRLILKYTKPSEISKMRPRYKGDFSLIQPLHCESCGSVMTTTGRLPTVNNARSWPLWEGWTVGDELRKAEPRNTYPYMMRNIHHKDLRPLQQCEDISTLCTVCAKEYYFQEGEGDGYYKSKRGKSRSRNRDPA